MTRGGVLIDTGPLVALLSRADVRHERAKAVAAGCAPPFRTCEAVLAEAAHHLAKIDGAAPAGLLALGRTGAVALTLRIDEHWAALERTLVKYRDVPASLADVCLIRCAELYQEPRIFTFDSDFTIYRWSRSRRFEVIS
jgi:predicted nucleic acid-binding protein